MASSPYVLYKEWLLLRVISTRRCTPACFKLTKLFGIDDFSAAKDFGKVFMIIIYCFYNYLLLLLLLNEKMNKDNSSSFPGIELSTCLCISQTDLCSAFRFRSATYVMSCFVLYAYSPSQTACVVLSPRLPLSLYVEDLFVVKFIAGEP